MNSLLNMLLCECVSGLTADARILIDWARVECQSYRLRLEDPVTVEYITKFIASNCQVSSAIIHPLSTYGDYYQ